MPQTPKSPEAQVQWLVDRAEITELLNHYTLCIDRFDFQGQADLFTDDGYLNLPFGRFDKAVLPQPEHTNVLMRYKYVQHSISNPIIDIDGDEAKLRCNVHAVHVHGEVGPSGGAQHGTVGGVYKVELRREDDCWKIVVMDVDFLWVSGELLH